jgi:two-component system sensor kinase FixL
LVAARHTALAFETRFAPSIPPVLIDKVQVQQVVVNLVRNAIEAMNGVAHPALTVGTRMAADRFAEVFVCDRGPGLSPEAMRQLFRPLVTTKKAGLGIGLSISRSIVEAHGGALRAEANPDGGTIFRFTLPFAPASDGSPR